MKSIPEYDLHSPGMHADDALAQFERIVSAHRMSREKMFAVITGYGSTGGTNRIKSSILSKCRKYAAQNHIRGFLDGEKAGDMFSMEFLSFPDAAAIPLSYKRSCNPGVVIVSV